MRVKLLATALAFHTVAAAQSLSVTVPKFEVASIKAVGLKSSGACPESLRIDGGFVYFKCATLPMLIGYAYRISPDRIRGLDGLRERFDIAATIPFNATRNQVPEMLQAVLAERFNLLVHRGELKETVLALVVLKGGLKIRPAAATGDAPDSATDQPGQTYFGNVITRRSAASTTISNPRMGTVRQINGPDRRQRWNAPYITFVGLADLLESVVPLPLPVVDMTGMAGRYELALDVTLNESARGAVSLGVAPRDPAAAGVDQRGERDESILRDFNIGLRRLGLQLERRKGSIETLVVDHVDKTPALN